MLRALAFTVPNEHGKTLAYLHVSTVWQVLTSAIPEQNDTTSHVHLTSNRVVGAYHYPVPTGVGNKA